MPRLIWTPEALRDIQSCYWFLFPKNPTAVADNEGSGGGLDNVFGDRGQLVDAQDAVHLSDKA